MALLKYLKLDPKRLPHPSGPLSTVVPASSIAAANEEVIEIVKEENKKERGPCGRSAEYCLVPVILQVIVPPRRKNEEQINDIRLDTWPTVTSPRTTATANLSSGLLNSNIQGSSSPIVASHMAL